MLVKYSFDPADEASCEIEVFYAGDRLSISQVQNDDVFVAIEFKLRDIDDLISALSAIAPKIRG